MKGKFSSSWGKSLIVTSIKLSQWKWWGKINWREHLPYHFLAHPWGLPAKVTVHGSYSELGIEEDHLYLDHLYQSLRPSWGLFPTKSLDFLLCDLPINYCWWNRVLCKIQSCFIEWNVKSYVSIRKFLKS